MRGAATVALRLPARFRPAVATCGSTGSANSTQTQLRLAPAQGLDQRTGVVCLIQRRLRRHAPGSSAGAARTTPAVRNGVSAESALWPVFRPQPGFAHPPSPQAQAAPRRSRAVKAPSVIPPSGSARPAASATRPPGWRPRSQHQHTDSPRETAKPLPAKLLPEAPLSRVSRWRDDRPTSASRPRPRRGLNLEHRDFVLIRQINRPADRNCTSPFAASGPLQLVADRRVFGQIVGPTPARAAAAILAAAFCARGHPPIVRPHVIAFRDTDDDVAVARLLALAALRGARVTLSASIRNRPSWPPRTRSHSSSTLNTSGILRRVAQIT